MYSLKRSEQREMQRSHLRFNKQARESLVLDADVGVKADIRFFLDHAVNMAVACVAQNKCERARLVVTGQCSVAMNILISMTEEHGIYRFLAYTNDSSFFGGGSIPSLYVIDQSSRNLEHAIFLFLSERLANESQVSAYIYREKTGSMFDPPVLFGTSAEGPRSIRERLGNIGI